METAPNDERNLLVKGLNRLPGTTIRDVSLEPEPFDFTFINRSPAITKKIARIIRNTPGTTLQVIDLDGPAGDVLFITVNPEAISPFLNNLL